MAALFWRTWIESIKTLLFLSPHAILAYSSIGMTIVVTYIFLAQTGSRCLILFKTPNACFNSTCYHPPPGTPPGICNFVHTWRSIPPPPGHAKKTFPNPRDSSSTTNTLFCVENIDPYNSKTRRFDKNSNAFLEFLERKTLHV